MFAQRFRTANASIDSLRSETGRCFPNFPLVPMQMLCQKAKYRERLTDSFCMNEHPPATLPLALDDLPHSLGYPSHGRVTIGGESLAVTPVFDAYWRFAAERQQIFFRRLERRTVTLTTDPVLERFRFTNAYRASDRVSQYLIRRVIYRDDLPPDYINLFFRILLFKLFNKIETWQLLESELGPLAWETFAFDRYDALLSRTKARGDRIYSAAYIMPSGRSAFGHPAKHQNHLRLIEWTIRNDYPARLARCASMSTAFTLLRSIPSLGPFLAYQYVTDFNYSTLTKFSEHEFVVAGPGALDGIDKCFVGAKRVAAADVIRYMYENQERHFAALGLQFASLWGRRLQLIDCSSRNFRTEVHCLRRGIPPSGDSTKEFRTALAGHRSHRQWLWPCKSPDRINV